VHKQAQTAWDGISMEQLLEELQQIQQDGYLLDSGDPHR
jgi:DNA-binding IclR family transcriptional regulator